jgi:hypothetical protein
MGFLEQLLGDLPEVVDEADRGVLLQRVVDAEIRGVRRGNKEI